MFKRNISCKKGDASFEVFVLGPHKQESVEQNIRELKHKRF